MIAFELEMQKWVEFGNSIYNSTVNLEVQSRGQKTDLDFYVSDLLICKLSKD